MSTADKGSVPTTRLRAKSLTFLSWTGVVSALLVIPVALVDPAISGFLITLSILLAGIGTVGSTSATWTLAAISISLSVTSAAVLYHYSDTTGLRVPSMASILGLSMVLGWPLAIAFTLMVLGALKRIRRKRTSAGA